MLTFFPIINPGQYWFYADESDTLWMRDLLGSAITAAILGLAFWINRCAKMSHQDSRHRSGQFDEETDAKRIESNKPIFSRIDLFYNERRILDEYVTTKLPIYDRKGDVIRLMGVCRISTELLSLTSTRMEVVSSGGTTSSFGLTMCMSGILPFTMGSKTSIGLPSS
ncbi:MAG: hypothetical protein ACN4GG_01135 [Akkermansiaceae bacterium]